MTAPAAPEGTLPRTTALPCAARTTHSPEPDYCHLHHIWPKGWGGPDVKTNLVSLCPTCHANVHILLDYYMKNNGDVSWEIRKHYGSALRAIAEDGWTRYKGSK